ncbi:calcium uniporter protein 2, mitochondrial [Medicago truncatula]|uniref:PPR containing plant-like protein n=1 Tax=Medicago truncatula TaxID=3880 RepID=G7LFI5_MEDTR|nr:calcium uniporter protein 2, mitochondrial [Medicago truncatula]AET03972.1 PPR containing plant-like protein [Medicago truncatula]
MAFKKTLTQRLLSLTKISSQSLSNCRISSSSLQSRHPSFVANRDIAPEPGDSSNDGVLRRFLHKQAVFNSELRPPHPGGSDGLLQKLREMDIARNRIRLDGLTPPEAEMEVATEELKSTAEDVRKLLRATQLEAVKSKIRMIQQSCVTYSEFVEMCGENCSDQEQAKKIAKILDDSATVIILGDVVFLKPEQVAKTIQALFPVPAPKPNEAETKELEEMEKQKATIDSRAHTMARRELWGGLGFVLVQILASMRLTFWELNWDVMEPICFYATSMYFMAGYTFFLRTSKEPSFEGFYQSRFSTKQKQLMKLHNFDIARYNQLRDASPPAPSSELNSTIVHPLNQFHRNI